MNQSTFDRVADELLREAATIQTAKRPGYTMGNEDVLRNFKQAGERAGVTPEQAWAVYFLKHIDAITSVMTRPDLPVAEAPLGRFSDAINYLQLGYALLKERDQATTNSKPAPSA
jgi:hypothetical protein